MALEMAGMVGPGWGRLQRGPGRGRAGPGPTPSWERLLGVSPPVSQAQGGLLDGRQDCPEPRSGGCGWSLGNRPELGLRQGHTEVSWDICPRGPGSWLGGGGSYSGAPLTSHAQSQSGAPPPKAVHGQPSGASVRVGGAPGSRLASAHGGLGRGHGASSQQATPHLQN